MGVLTGTWITVKDARGSTLRMENNVHDPNYEMMQDNEWTYDDAERTAVCVSEDGVTEKIWYDEQQRVLRDEYYTPDVVFYEPAPSMIFLTLPDKSGNLLQIQT